MHWFAIFIATALVQLINITSARRIEDPSNMLEVMKMAAWLLPISYLATLAFAYYFGNASKLFDYNTLSLISLLVTILAGLGVSLFVFKQDVLTLPVLAGTLLCACGLYLIVGVK